MTSLRASSWLLLLLLSACAVEPPVPSPAPVETPTRTPTRTSTPGPTPPAEPAPPAAPVEPAPIPTPALTLPTLEPAAWTALPDWRNDTLADAWPALLQSCSTLKKQTAWRTVCNAATALPAPDDARARAFFEQYFRPYRATQEDGADTGVVTGYYEPLLKGDRIRTERARYPLYAVPDDLVTVDLASIYPELKSLRLRGRLVGNTLAPYPARKEIEAPGFRGKPIAWAEDPVDLFFLHVQGSGRIELPDGAHMRVGYADQNGHPYQSIGKRLVERGELKLEQASMQGIKRWGAKHPDQLPGLLASNPSYVFFRELPASSGGPLGALGVPLTDRRSIAVDPRFIPLGAPVFLATTEPDSPRPLNRLMLAQDTGSAIRGGVRADFFWGFGDAAGELAGRMKQTGRMWVLLPKDYPLTTVRK